MADIMGNLKKRPVLAALGLVSFLLAAIPIPYVAAHLASLPEYTPALVFLLLSLAADLARLLLGEKDRAGLLTLVSVLLKALAFAFFALGGVLSVADYVAKIHLFGDSSQFPAIMGFGAALLLSAVTGVVQSFLK